MKKTSKQNRQFHAMLHDIAAQVKFAGRYWRPSSWKRLMVECYVNVERNLALARGDPDPFPGLSMVTIGVDGDSIVTLGEQVRRFTLAQMSDLIESTSAYGSELNVTWSEKSQTGEE